MPGCAFDGMYQARVGIYADMSFHPEVLLVALFARMHFKVVFAALVLCQTRFGNQRNVYCAA